MELRKGEPQKGIKTVGGVLALSRSGLATPRFLKRPQNNRGINPLQELSGRKDPSYSFRGVKPLLQLGTPQTPDRGVKPLYDWRRRWAIWSLMSAARSNSSFSAASSISRFISAMTCFTSSTPMASATKSGSDFLGAL